ncbi:MAG: SDR family oxidoreductase [Phycisphaeraceae bacterium]
MDTHRVAIVTGASDGIGRETAVLLAQAGYDLALIARRRDRLDETAARVTDALGSTDHRTLILPTDLTDDHATRAAALTVVEHFGRVDAVANVAGHAPLMPIEALTPDIWRQCIDTNLSAIVMLTAALWPTFRRQQRGTIVNVSSMASIDPFPGFAAYAAAKVGVNMFTKCTADEGSAIGLKAVALVLGAVETPMLRSLFSEDVLPRDQTMSPITVATVIRDCIAGSYPFDNGQTIVLEGE